MIIDAHTHVFPEPLADRALSEVSRISGDFLPTLRGTVSALRQSMRESGIDASVIAPIATRPSQMASINAFSAAQAAADIIPLGSVHPDAKDAVDELDRIVSLGMRGIKLHPEYQGFQADAPKYFPLYREIGRRGLVTLFHAGRDIAFPLPARSAPSAIARVLSCFDGAPVIAAHMGGYLMIREAMECYAGLPIHIDTSFSYGRLPASDAMAVIDILGPDRVLFGSDSPWCAQADELRWARALKLDPASLDLVLGGNALRLFAQSD